jgi:hypothetical protein
MKYPIIAPRLSNRNFTIKKHNKMKQLSLFAMALLLAASIASCKKDTTNGKVVFGNTHGMSVTSYDSTFHPEQYGHFSWGNTIDLNGDGENDVQFHSTSEIMEGGILTELNCLDNTAVLGELNNQKFSLWANNANDSFDSNRTFMSTKVALLRSDNVYFPMNEEKYIGFKLTENDKSRLGWMKVILHHDYVELLETAIQK